MQNLIYNSIRCDAAGIVNVVLFTKS